MPIPLCNNISPYGKLHEAIYPFLLPTSQHTDFGIQHMSRIIIRRPFPLIRRHAEHLLKISGKCRHITVAHLKRNFLHRRKTFQQKLTRLLKPDYIDIIIRSHIHTFLKNPSKMSLTDSAHLCQILNLNFLVIMFLHITECGRNLEIPGTFFSAYLPEHYESAAAQPRRIAAILSGSPCTYMLSGHTHPEFSE